MRVLAVNKDHTGGMVDAIVRIDRDDVLATAALSTSATSLSEEGLGRPKTGMGET